jgi:hypothetical protein
MCVNAKIIPVEIVPWIRGRGGKVEHWKGWTKVWYSWYILRTFINATKKCTPPPWTRINEKKSLLN